MHINIAKGNLVIGYSDKAYQKYKEKVQELLSNGYILKGEEYCLNGDKIEYFIKGEEVFSINQLAI